MGSAVLNLQKSILAGKQSPTELLRQSKIIASHVGLADVEKWVDFELNGYPEEIEPPDYRRVMADDPRSEHSAPMQFPVYYSINEIEACAQREQVKFVLTGEVADTSEVPPSLRVGGDQFKHILEAVVNELLRWALELQSRGIEGENLQFNDQEKQAAVNQTFHLQHMIGRERCPPRS